MNRESAVVVGGGICGLVAALLLKKNYKEVTIIEQSAEVGGLFRSVSDNEGVRYDMGSHIPNSTGIDDIDSLLFPKSEIEKNWNVIPELKSGNYFFGSWDLDSPFPDGRKIDPAHYATACGELIGLTDLSTNSLIYYACLETLGPIFTHTIILPILKKLYGQDVDYKSLTMDAGLFGFTRILALPRDVAAKLKELPAFDAKLGYQNKADFLLRKQREQLTTPTYFYPSGNRSVECLIDVLKAQIHQQGISIRTSTRVEVIEVENNSVKSIVMKETEEELKCDLLFWSAPPFLALKAMDIPVPASTVDLRTAVIFHLNFDMSLLDTQSHYLWVWEHSTSIFRLTLYPNLQGNSKHNNLSVEILCAPSEVEQFIVDDIVKELQEMGVVSKQAALISYAKQIEHNTFPVPTTQFSQHSKFNYDKLCESVDNIIVSGRYGGKCWRQADVLVDAYNSIRAAE